MNLGPRPAKTKSASMSHIRNILAVSLRESRRILSSPLYIFSLVGAPLLCFVFFLTLMGKGLPSGLPVGVVDMDRAAWCVTSGRSSISR